MNAQASPVHVVAPSRPAPAPTHRTALPERTSAPTFLLPREPFPPALTAVLAMLTGIAAAYALTIAVPTSNAYTLRKVERSILQEKNRQEALVSRKASLQLLPHMLHRGKEMGLDNPLPVSLVVEPRP
ncbi:MAG: hypothetical protein ACOVT5_04505 [Armatimonadaceae bacterium]